MNKSLQLYLLNLFITIAFGFFTIIIMTRGQITGLGFLFISLLFALLIFIDVTYLTSMIIELGYLTLYFGLSCLILYSSTENYSEIVRIIISNPIKLIVIAGFSIFHLFIQKNIRYFILEEE